MSGAEVDLRHLAAFLAVAETLHFGRAAQRLHLAQPAVSQQIRRLETLVGARLFDRDRRSTTLTEAGRALLPHARRTLAASNHALETARAAARGDTGRLRVGIAPSAAADPVLRTIRELSTATPQLTIEVVELRQRDLITALRDDELDLGVGAVLQLPPVDTGISWSTIAEEPFVLALPTDHPRATNHPWVTGHVRDAGAPREAAESVRLADFNGEPFVGFARDDGPRYHDTLGALLADVGVVPSREAIIKERSTQLALVSAGLGVALVPASTRVLRQGDVVYRSLRETSPTLTTITAWRTGSSNPVLARVLAGGTPVEADGVAGVGVRRLDGDGRGVQPPRRRRPP